MFTLVPGSARSPEEERGKGRIDISSIHRKESATIYSVVSKGRDLGTGSRMVDQRISGIQGQTQTNPGIELVKLLLTFREISPGCGHSISFWLSSSRRKRFKGW